MKLFDTISLEKSITLFRWAQALRFCIFSFPITLLLFKYKGLDLGDFFIAHGIFYIFGLLLEIPTGYIGDLFSRKRIIVIAFLFAEIGILTWLFLDGYFMFLGVLCFSSYYILYSGTGDAYLYDILKKQKKEATYLKEQGKIKAYCAIAGLISTILGGLIYKNMGPEAVMIAELVLTTISIGMVLYLPNISNIKRKVEAGKSKWKDILDIAKYASTHREIKWLMLFPAVFGSGTLMLMWGQQAIMDNKLIAVALFGVFLGCYQLARSVFFYNAHKIFNKLKTKSYSILMFSILILGILTAWLIMPMNNTTIIYFMLAFIGIAAGTEAALSVVMNSMINHRIKSDERATILSVSSMFGQLFCGIAMISLKFLIDGVGLQTTFAIMGVVIISLTLVSMLKLLRLKI